ncbi:MAG: serine protease [Ralstonia sp.]
MRDVNPPLYGLWPFRIHSMKAFGICVLCALSAAGCATKSIQPDSDLAARNLESSLGGRGVEIDLVRGEAQQSWGSGFSLGGGYILTAAHVVDSAGGETGIFVRFYDEIVPAQIVAIGNRVDKDVAVLKLDRPVFALPVAPQVPLCKAAIAPAEPLLVVSAGGPFRSYSLPAGYPGVASALGTGATTTHFAPGASGSAVISVPGRCIGGVISQQAINEASTGHHPRGMVQATDYSTTFSDLAALKAVLSIVPSTASAAD